jgi:hypothetical protein
LIVELEKRFWAQELLNAIGVIYLQYWLALKAKATFPGHMALFQTYYEHSKSLGTFRMFVGPLLNPKILDQQSSFFKLTMQNHFQAAMQPLHDCNPTSRLWERFGISGILNQNIF